jgi:ATPase subunit of ABC transporter with duplicated ATPase domains
MSNPKRIEVNCTTGEVLEIELTDEEVAQREADAAAHAVAEAEREAAQAAVEAARASANEKLAGLGLTTEEIAALTK